MKVEIENGDRKVSIEVDIETLDAVDKVKKAAEGLMSSLQPPKAASLPFGFSVWADTERAPEEVAYDGDDG